MDPLQSKPPSVQPDATRKLSHLTEIPKELKLNILKFLGIKDLSNATLVNRLWTVLAADPKRWVELANNLKINISSPTKVREEVIQYFVEIKKINEKLVENILKGLPISKEIESLTDPVDKNRAIRKFIKENIHNSTLRKRVDDVVDAYLIVMGPAAYGVAMDKEAAGVLKMLLQDDIGVVTKNNAKMSGWKPIIYLARNLNEYKKLISFRLYEEASTTESELYYIIKYNNLEFAKFIFSKLKNAENKSNYIAYAWINSDIEKIDLSLMTFLLSELDKNTFLTKLTEEKERAIAGARANRDSTKIAKIESRAKAMQLQWEKLQKKIN